MTKTRKQHTAEFKLRVSLEGLKEQEPLEALGQRFGVHISQIQRWKSQVQKEGSRFFKDKRSRDTASQEKMISQLHEKIGQLRVERDFLERVLGR